LLADIEQSGALESLGKKSREWGQQPTHHWPHYIR
jgi:hypothetical protein